MITFHSSPKFDQEATVLLIEQDQIKKSKFYFSNKALTQTLAQLAKSNQFNGEAEQIFPFFSDKKLYLFVGVGAQKDNDLTQIRSSLRKALLSSYVKNIKHIEIIPHDKQENVIQAAIEAIYIGTYVWRKYQSQEKNKLSVPKTYSIAVADQPSFQETIKICEGVTLTRDLVNDNASFVTSEYFEKVIRELIRGEKNVSLEILNRKEMKAKGLNLHLAVNQGSEHEPKLIIIKYTGSSKKGNYTALVGKGVTFDTGGINLKTSGHVETMRQDMSGAGAIVGVLKNTLVLKLKKKV